MNLNKQILEAIQKGINLAVDDYNDEDTIKVQKKARIKNDVHIKDLIPYIDLGLPSGTLWYKYNIGVDLGLLETAEDWYGNYYTFEEANNLDGYKMPTLELIQELIDETKSEWVKNYKGIEELNGRTFTGKNGNSIFIPASGYLSGSLLNNSCYCCYSWSSSLYLPFPQRYGYYLYSNSYSVYLGSNYRHNSFTARPVLNRKS